MSWHFSRVLVEEYSGESSSDGRLCALLKTMPSAEGFSSHGKTISYLKPSLSGMTCERLTAFHGEVLLTWFLAGFLVRTSALPAKVLESQAPKAGCGSTSPESSGKLPPPMFSLRTPQCSSPVDSEKSSKTLTSWGMMRNGEIFVLKTPSGLKEIRASITSVSVSGLDAINARRLATATATDHKRGDYPGDANRKSPGLANQIHRLPTSRANDAQKRGAFDENNPRNGLPAAIKRLRTPLASDGEKQGHGNLPHQIKRPRTPLASDATMPGEGNNQIRLPHQIQRMRTPQATDADSWNKMTTEERLAKNQQVRLPNELAAGGKQSPMWTEWFMGFPIGWTALEPLETHKFRQWLNSHGKL